MQTDRRARATRRLSLALFVFATAAPCAAQSGGQASVAVTEMFATVTVTDKKQAPVPNLPRSAFGMWDGKTAQELTSFVGGDAPASIAILFDLSDSVRVGAANKLRDATSALPRLTQLGRGSNEYFVFAFADDVTTLLDGSGDTEAAASVVRAAARAPSGRQSSFWDACYLAIPKLARSPNAKRALILVTDGEDTYSRAREDDILRLLKENNVVAYSFNVRTLKEGDVRVEGTRTLDKLSKVSGGISFNPRDAKEWEAAVETVAAELRSQYVLGFRPTATPAAGQCLNLTISVTPPEGFAADGKSFVARGRKTFCAPRAEVRRVKSP
jgi:Ca-activated chloride channel family protein